VIHAHRGVGKKWDLNSRKPCQIRRHACDRFLAASLEGTRGGITSILRDENTVEE
jgi:hypothetical protein